jgi:hypothetical protein
LSTAIKPPLPAAVIAWLRAKLVTEMSARRPVRVPRRYVSSTSQLSSTTRRPWRSAMSRIASQSGQLPTRFGVMIAFVRGPIIPSILLTSIWNVSGSTSTNAGTIPLRTSGAMSLENVSGDVITSSPGSQPSRSTASQHADVPLFTITPCRWPRSSAQRRSNSSTLGPSSSVPVRRTSTIASISRSSCTPPASVTR